MSSLAPANVEVSDMQFQQCQDPELEERAQAAINSYFKENEIGLFLVSNLVKEFPLIFSFFVCSSKSHRMSITKEKDHATK